MGVRVIDEKEYAEVEFHSTPETTGKDPLNTLRLCCSTLSSDDSVSRVYLKEEGEAFHLIMLTMSFVTFLCFC